MMTPTKKKALAENASTVSENSNSHVEEEAQEFVFMPREEAPEMIGRNKKKKSKKRKNRDMEVKESAARLLYYETPSEESERVLPSPRKAKTKKPRPFSKVWSNEDEITILEGMIRFKRETGPDVARNMVKIYPLILKSLGFKANLAQLRRKVRRLKEKYKKSVENGSGSKTLHEEKLFHLCEKIWTGNPKQVTEQPKSSGSGQPAQQNVLVNGQGQKQNIPEIGSPGQWSRHNIIIPETGLNGQALEALFERLSKDVELVINSQACLPGNQKEVDMRAFGIYLESLKLRIKFEKLVLEKANSPELRDSPELLKQEVLRAYLEVKIELTEQLLNAYNSFSKVNVAVAAPAKHMKKGRREAENEIEKLVSRKKQKKHVAVAQAAEKKMIDAKRKEKKNKKQESSSSDDSLKKTKVVATSSNNDEPSTEEDVPVAKKPPANGESTDESSSSEEEDAVVQKAPASSNEYSSDDDEPASRVVTPPTKVKKTSGSTDSDEDDSDSDADKGKAVAVSKKKVGSSGDNCGEESEEEFFQG